MSTIWSGFYKLSLKERQHQLRLCYPLLFDSSAGSAFQHLSGLDEKLADNMIENCIGVLGVPLGLAPHFIINGKSFIIPLATEEASIVAGAAKTICGSGIGFKTTPAIANIIIAQVQLLDINNEQEILDRIAQHQLDIITEANRYCSKMVKRGGGVKSISARPIYNNDSKLVCVTLHLHIDTCDSMGANCANAVAEGISPYLASILSVRIGICVLSNFAPERLTTASFEIHVDHLGYKSISGSKLASMLIEANDFATYDIYRATTHNKGILNGMDALALATGQDTRALAAAIHSFAAKDGSYKGLTQYSLENNILHGSITVPICVGSQGGVTHSNPLFAYTYAFLHNPSSAELAQIMAAVGLASNFAALRALVSEGISKGHMKLHARNIAMSVGCPTHLIEPCVEYMMQHHKYDREVAKAFIEMRCTMTSLLPSPDSVLGKDDLIEPSILIVELWDDILVKVAYESVGTRNTLVFGNKSSLSILGDQSNIHESFLFHVKQLCDLYFSFNDYNQRIVKLACLYVMEYYLVHKYFTEMKEFIQTATSSRRPSTLTLSTYRTEYHSLAFALFNTLESCFQSTFDSIHSAKMSDSHQRALMACLLDSVDAELISTGVYLFCPESEAIEATTIAKRILSHQ